MIRQMAERTRILVVDDERSMREMLSILLARHDYDVTTATSGNKAIRLLEGDDQFDLVITDLMMDRGSGIDVLETVKSQDPSCEVIVITAFGTTESAVEAMKKGAYDYLAKPFNVDEFLIIVRQALERRALIRENTDLRARVRGEYRFEDIVGRSAPMRDVIAICRKVSGSAATVLITGESGTGKEVAARAIHFGGERADKPFVPVNCGALPEQLMESEMFGHVRGAFTGATDDKQGLFTAADGGTVFLDEVAELAPPLQVKLLRVLQDRRVRPVGSNEELPVDVRVISASNRDLEQLVAAGSFRTDLFYRLNVITIAIPPLRERPEDIPPLITDLLARHAVETGTAVSRVSRAALLALAGYDFPGNVRELSNILERAATLADGERIELADLPDAVRHERRESAPVLLPQDGADLDNMLTHVEQRLIEQALDRVGGVQTKAASLLGLSPRSLRYRMSKLEIDSSDDDK
jgi:two-component system response regulator PilR (NtrC family)